VNPVGIRSCYDEGKRCAETLFFDYHRQHRLEIKVARIFNTYGPRMHPGRRARGVELHCAGAEERADHDLRRRAADAVVLLRRRPHRRVRRLHGDARRLHGAAQPRQSQPSSASSSSPNDHRRDRIALEDREEAAAGRRSVAAAADIALARQHLGWEPKVDLAAGLVGPSLFRSMLGRAEPRAS
jgi:nucleoside-diphosphate-sugar epimerase